MKDSTAAEVNNSFFAPVIAWRLFHSLYRLRAEACKVDPDQCRWGLKSLEFTLSLLVLRKVSGSSAHRKCHNNPIMTEILELKP